MSSDERTGLNTPPFRLSDQRPAFTGGQPMGGYTAADFPAPAGVPLLTETRPTTEVPQRRRGFGTVIAASLVAAVVGAGVGVGSYATLVAGAPVNAPISVSTVPASQSPQLDGTVAAAAAKIQPSVVTISVAN